MVEHEPPRAQEARHGAKVALHLRAAHVLEHAHRGDLVEGLRHLQLTVVAQLHADPALQAARLDQLLHMGMLVARQGDAGGIDAVMFGRPQKQTAPAGTDVQEPLARRQAQLAADVVELGLLCLGQRKIGRAVVGTRIDAARVQP